MTTYRLMDGESGRPGSGPGTGTSYGGDLVVGACFGVTQGDIWLEGYYWWPPAVNGDTQSGQKFCLYQITGTDTGTLVPLATATAGTLTADAWNFVPLSSPLLLTPAATGSSDTYGAAYMACTGKVFVSGFPETKDQFGSTETYAGGITNGPLFGFSSTSGSLAVGGSSGWVPQMPFTTGISDPTAGMPTQNDSDANLWLDIQVSDAAPAGSQEYRAFPNSPAYVVPGQSPTATGYTLGLEFTLSESCSLEKIWHYSPPAAAALPTDCGIWVVSTQTVLSGSHNTSPAWTTASGDSASAGDGWVYCDYSASGITLEADTNYKASTAFLTNNSDTWFLAQVDFWGSADPFPDGITQGPLTVLGNSVSTQGQDSWNQSLVWTYPATGNISNPDESPEFDGLDVEVSPQAAISAAAGLPGEGLILPADSTVRTEPATIAGDALISPAGVIVYPAAALAAGEGAISPAGVVTRVAGVTIAASGEILIAYSAAHNGPAALTADGRIVPGTGLPVSPATFAFWAPQAAWQFGQPRQAP